MRDDGIAATAVLGLAGFVVLAVSEYACEVEQAVETTAEEGWCPGCGVRARLHDRRPTWVRDLPAAGRPVTLVWVKRVWRCVEPRCPRRTWTETRRRSGRGRRGPSGPGGRRAGGSASWGRRWPRWRPSSGSAGRR